MGNSLDSFSLPVNTHARIPFFNRSAFGIKVCYSLEANLLGTSGTVKNAEQFIDRAFFVFNGDFSF